MRLFSVKHEFPNEWYRFLRPTDQNAASQSMTMDLAMERFSYLFRGRTLAASKIDVFLNFRDGTSIRDYGAGSPLGFTLTPDGGDPLPAQLDSIASAFAGTPHKELSVDVALPSKLTMEVKEDDVKKIAPALREQIPAVGPSHMRLKGDVIDDIWLVVHYSVS